MKKEIKQDMEKIGDVSKYGWELIDIIIDSSEINIGKEFIYENINTGEKTNRLEIMPITDNRKKDVGINLNDNLEITKFIYTEIGMTDNKFIYEVCIFSDEIIIKKDTVISETLLLRPYCKMLPPKQKLYIVRENSLDVKQDEDIFYNETCKNGVIVFDEPEKCPFCDSYNVYHMMPIGHGPTRGCKKCNATWMPLLKKVYGSGDNLKDKQ